MDYQKLKERQRAERETHSINLALRVHRSLSWLNRAERAEDQDGKFIFLWIAFNAAYATEIDEAYRLSEQETFKAFIHKVCLLDQQHKLEALVWNEFPSSIRMMLNNKFVFQSFWDYQNGKISNEEWRSRFSSSKKRVTTALAKRNTAEVLGVIFNRIYTLRNQLLHGGATWNSQVNRDQVRDCVNFFEKFVINLIEIMLDHPETLWGDACYPVVESE